MRENQANCKVGQAPRRVTPPSRGARYEPAGAVTPGQIGGVCAMNIEIRPAVADDAEAIRDLVRSERLNPSRLDWPHFVVAAVGERLIGTIQLRPHAPGVVELASLAVRPEYRGQRIAAQLMDAILARAEGRVLAVASTRHAELYRRWGFRHVPLKRAPGSIARTF